MYVFRRYAWLESRSVTYGFDSRTAIWLVARYRLDAAMAVLAYQTTKVATHRRTTFSRQTGLLRSLLEKPGVLCENGPTAQLKCEVTGSAAGLCSPTCRSRRGSLSTIRCGNSGSWRIRPAIASIPPSARSTPQKSGHRCRRSSCWPRCRRHSTESARSGCYWSRCTTTCYFAG